MGVQKCCGQQSCTENDLPPKNDRRCQLINEIKELIGNIEHEDKAKPRLSRRPDRGVPGMRDLEDECRQWRKRRDCTPPLITAIALHETRPTSDYSNMRHENTSQRTYVDATQEGQEWRQVPPAPWDLPRTPSQELRAGNLYVNCQCLKRNGLQHDCPRWECGGRPQCVAVNPGPCCVPSQWPKPIRGDRRYGNKLQQTQASAAGNPGSGQKQLKTGPLNPDICIPMGASSQLQRIPGGPGQEMGGFLGVPQQGKMEIVTVGRPMQQESPHGLLHNVQGNPGSGQKQLKMGPLNPEICIPMGASSQPQRIPGGPGQEMGGFISVPQQGKIEIVTVGRPMQQGASHGHLHNVQGMVQYNHSHQMTQPPPPIQGRAPHDAVMVLDLCQVQPGIQSRQPPQAPQGQGAAQGITLSAPGITCCCRPVQSTPAAGIPGGLGAMGIPMVAASCPMP